MGGADGDECALPLSVVLRDRLPLCAVELPTILAHSPSAVFLPAPFHRRTFLVRSQSIIRTARSMFDSDNTVMLNKLTEYVCDCRLTSSSEQVLFRQIVEDVTAENRWWQRKCQEMEYSTVEFSSKKCRLS